KASTRARANGLVSWMPKPHSVSGPDASPSAGGAPPPAAGVCAKAPRLMPMLSDPARLAPIQPDATENVRRDRRGEAGRFDRWAMDDSLLRDAGVCPTCQHCNVGARRDGACA